MRKTNRFITLVQVINAFLRIYYMLYRLTPIQIVIFSICTIRLPVILIFVVLPASRIMMARQVKKRWYSKNGYV